MKDVEENLAIFELNKTLRMIQDFINDDLSNWYIRRSRRRFWATELTEDKKQCTIQLMNCYMVFVEL